MKKYLVNLRTADEELKRMEFISGWLSQRQIEVETRTVCIEKGETAENLKTLISDGQTSSIRTSHELAEEAYQFISWQKTAESMVHQQIEALLFSERRWWPRCYGSSALIELIKSATETLDTSARGMVVGDNPFSRVALYVLSQLGYTQLDLVCSDESKGRHIMESFQKRNFGLELGFIHASDLTMQSSQASILINTIREEQDPELIEDLCYFNFLKSNGLVIDLYPDLHENRLMGEAKEVGMEIISGQRLQARIDFLWLADLYPELSDEWSDYIEAWLKHWQKLREESPPVKKRTR